MSYKRALNIFYAVVLILFLWAILYAARFVVRRIALKRAAAEINEKFFNNGSYHINYKRRVVTFDQTEVGLLKKYKLNGKISIEFPVRFFEFPWNVNLRRITVKGVNWDVDLQKNTINGIKRDEFLQTARAEIDKNFPGKKKKYIALATDGILNLTNPEGKKRTFSAKSILNITKDFYLLGIHAGDMKVNFIYRESDKKIIGQYQAQQSDFEFFRLSFGIPELFEMTGVRKLAGQFGYDAAARKIEYIRGSSDFGVQSCIKGSIFTLYGSRRGKINWEYLNSQNWFIELRNAVSGTPLRTGLHYLVISQNTLEKDALNFDGELEFYPQSFKNMFGLELDSRSASIRHRLVGKWDMRRKSWELSRLDTRKRVPQVKLKWNGFDVAFQGQSFKISGSGAQSDHFGFHYELAMGNVDLKDRRGNIIIGSQVKLDGDCILSLSDDNMKPVLTGRISCEVADGAMEKSRFMFKNIKLTFAPDIDEKNKYAFSVADVKLGLPDFKKGVNIAMKNLDGRISPLEIFIGAPHLSLQYQDLNLNGREWEIKRYGNSDELAVTISPLRGKWMDEIFKIGRINGNISSGKKKWQWQGTSNAVSIGKKLFKASSVTTSVSGEFTDSFYPVCRELSFVPRGWSFANNHLKCVAPASYFSFYFDEKGILQRNNVDFGQLIVNIGNMDHIMPGMVLNEISRGKYFDGTLKCEGRPYKFDFAYSRPRKKWDITVKSGRIDGNDENIWGINGNIKFINKDVFCVSTLGYAELKQNDRVLENGNIKFAISDKKGIELQSFDGTFASEMAKISYIGRNKHGENMFDVKKFPAKYVETALGVPEGMFSGMFDGRISVKAGEFYNPFKIQTFYLKNNFVARMRMGALESAAQKGDTVDDDFARDALRDFFAKSLVLELQKVRGENVLKVKALGKSTELLPYEFDIREKRLKRSKVALFNSEVEVMMKYIIKKP